MTTGADNSSHNTLFAHPPAIPPTRQPQPRDTATIPHTLPQKKRQTKHARQTTHETTRISHIPHRTCWTNTTAPTHHTIGHNSPIPNRHCTDTPYRYRKQITTTPLRRPRPTQLTAIDCHAYGSEYNTKRCSFYCNDDSTPCASPATDTGENAMWCCRRCG